jgi:hypothetical protein
MVSFEMLRTSTVIPDEAAGFMLREVYRQKSLLRTRIVKLAVTVFMGICLVQAKTPGELQRR